MPDLTPEEQVAKLRRDQRDREANAQREGRDSIAMPTVVKKVTGDGYRVDSTSSPWLTPGDLKHLVRLLDLEPQAAYTAMQNQIDSLQASQQQLLAAAFEIGPEITLEHLEAIQAAGERAVERLNAEAE